MTSVRSNEESLLDVPWWQVDLGPEAAAAAKEAVADRKLSQGAVCENLELEIARIVGSRFAVATSSGSTALTLGLMAVGVKPGDSVLVPAYSWVATAHAAHILGCNVELVDIEPGRPVMDIDLVPPVAEERAFAIPVHMNGHSADVDELRSKGYVVIEDAAQALGSQRGNRMLGTLGHLGCYSFSVAKIIGAGQGGMIVTDSEELATAARRARTHGVVNVFAPEKWETPGHNFRYNDVLASILLSQLPRLDERISHAKRLLREYSRQLETCSRLEIIRHSVESETGPYIEARVHREDRDGLVSYLNQRGIGARRAFPSLASADYIKGREIDFPNAYDWSAEVLYLPSGPSLPASTVAKVVEAIQVFFGSSDAFS